MEFTTEMLLAKVSDIKNASCAKKYAKFQERVAFYSERLEESIPQLEAAEARWKSAMRDLEVALKAKAPFVEQKVKEAPEILAEYQPRFEKANLVWLANHREKINFLRLEKEGGLKKSDRARLYTALFWYGRSTEIPSVWSGRASEWCPSESMEFEGAKSALKEARKWAENIDGNICRLLPPRRQYGQASNLYCLQDEEMEELLDWLEEFHPECIEKEFDVYLTRQYYRVRIHLKDGFEDEFEIDI